MPSSTFNTPVRFETYTETHTYAQIREGLENRTSSQQDILNVVDDVVSKYHIPSDLIISLYNRLKNPSAGELTGDLSLDYILLSAVDPIVLLMLFENFIPLLDGYSDEETKEIVRDYFFQLVDKTRDSLESYDEVYSKRSSLVPIDTSINLAAALLVQTGSTFYDMYTFNENLKNRNTHRQKSSKSSRGPSHPRVYLSEIFAFDSPNASISEQKAQERISNLFLSLSSVRKKSITPCQELEPYVPQGICRLDKKSGKLYPLRPTAYLVEVASHHTIENCIKQRNDDLD